MAPPSYPTYSLGSWVGNSTDSAGVEWYATTVEGLDDTPAADTAQYANPAGDGTTLGPVRFPSRTIAFTGTAVAPNRYEARAAIDRLRAAYVAARKQTTLTIHDLTGDRMATVIPADAVKVSPVNPFAFRFQFSVLAGDPRLYDTDERVATTAFPGAATSASGRGFPLTFPFGFGSSAIPGDVPLLNEGTAATFPRFRIDGPMTTATIRNNTTGLEMTLVYTLGVGEWLDIDTAARTILLNGTANRRSALQVGSRWPTLEPGYNAIQFRGQGTGALTVRWRSAWL